MKWLLVVFFSLECAYVQGIYTYGEGVHNWPSEEEKVTYRISTTAGDPRYLNTDTALANKITEVATGLTGDKLHDFVNQRSNANRSLLGFVDEFTVTVLFTLLQKNWYVSVNALLKTGAAVVDYNVGKVDLFKNTVFPVGSLLDLVVAKVGGTISYRVLRSWGAKRFTEQSKQSAFDTSILATLKLFAAPYPSAINTSDQYPQDYPKRLYFSVDGTSLVEGEDNPDFLALKKKTDDVLEKKALEQKLEEERKQKEQQKIEEEQKLEQQKQKEQEEEQEKKRLEKEQQKIEEEKKLEQQKQKEQEEEQEKKRLEKEQQKIEKEKKLEQQRQKEQEEKEKKKLEVDECQVTTEPGHQIEIREEPIYRLAYALYHTISSK